MPAPPGCSWPGRPWRHRDRTEAVVAVEDRAAVAERQDEAWARTSAASSRAVAGRDARLGGEVERVIGWSPAVGRVDGMSWTKKTSGSSTLSVVDPGDHLGPLVARAGPTRSAPSAGRSRPGSGEEWWARFGTVCKGVDPVGQTPVSSLGIRAWVARSSARRTPSNEATRMKRHDADDQDRRSPSSISVKPAGRRVRCR